MGENLRLARRRRKIAATMMAERANMSVMTLRALDGEEGHSHLEIAEWLAVNSAAPEADLHELRSRMVFSELVRNTDDHLRNHGFLLKSKGWRLAPMFDVNPNPNGGESALDRGDIVRDAEYYRLTPAQAERRYAEIRKAVCPHQAVAIIPYV